MDVVKLIAVVGGGIVLTWLGGLLINKCRGGRRPWLGDDDAGGLYALVYPDGTCGCCAGTGDHPCGHECTSCDGSGKQPDSPPCGARHGADCTCPSSAPSASR